MEQQITKTVLSVARKNEAIMREETGLGASVEDEEIVRACERSPKRSHEGES